MEQSNGSPEPTKKASNGRDVLEENASRAKELAEEVYKRIPDKIGTWDPRWEPLVLLCRQMLITKP